MATTNVCSDATTDAMAVVTACSTRWTSSRPEPDDANDDGRPVVRDAANDDAALHGRTPSLGSSSGQYVYGWFPSSTLWRSGTIK